MATIITRAGKGSPLTNAEVDANFTNLNSDKLETSGGTLTGPTVVNVNSSSTALRVTQTGAGAALLVEDEANPDSTPFIINASGNVGIGTNSPAVKLTISSTDAILVPVGDTAARPAGAAGYLRFNNSLGSFEGHNGTAWGSIVTQADSSAALVRATGSTTARALADWTADIRDTKVFAAPIGSGAGVVPAELRSRFRNVANARTDFGIQLFEPDGVTIRDNTTRLQAAIDAVQAYGGAIFFPNEVSSRAVQTGPVTLRETGVWERMPVALIGEGCGDTTRKLRDSFVGPPTQYALGPGLKLRPASAGSLITSPPGAGHLVIEHMGLDGALTDQLAPRRVVDMMDRSSGYGFGGNFRNVSIANSVAEGLFVGLNRAMGFYEDVWVQYCGALGGAPAWNIRVYDTQVVRPGVGNNPGTGIFLGSSAQFEMSGGALWNNDKHIVVGTDTLQLIVIGVHFDAATAAQVEIARYTADSRPAMRKFVGCYFSRRDTGASGTVPYVDGSADDIVTSCDALTLVGCSFIGRASGSGTRRSRYNLNMTDGSAKTMVLEDAKFGVANTLGFTNAPAQIWRWGDMSAAAPSHRIDGPFTVRTVGANDFLLLQAQDDTLVAAFNAGTAGKGGVMRLWNSAGSVDVLLGADTGIGRSRIGTTCAPEFANDAAAATGGLAIGDFYFNTTSNAYTKRRV